MRDAAAAGGTAAAGARALPVGVRARLPAGAPLSHRILIFLMSVCVLWLRQPAEGDAIVRWAAGFVNGGAGGVFVTYEQIHPHDAFGQVCGLHFPLI